MALLVRSNIVSTGPMADFVEQAVRRSGTDHNYLGQQLKFDFRRQGESGELLVSVGSQRESIPVQGNKLTLQGNLEETKGNAALLMRNTFLTPLGRDYDVSGRMSIFGFDRDSATIYNANTLHALSPNVVIHHDEKDCKMALIQRTDAPVKGGWFASKPYFPAEPHQAWKQVAGGLTNKTPTLHKQLMAKAGKLIARM